MYLSVHYLPMFTYNFRHPQTLELQKNSYLANHAFSLIKTQSKAFSLSRVSYFHTDMYIRGLELMFGNLFLLPFAKLVISSS